MTGDREHVLVLYCIVHFPILVPATVRRELQELFGRVCAATLVKDVGAGEQGLKGEDDEEEGAHPRRGAGNDCFASADRFLRVWRSGADLLAARVAGKCSAIPPLTPSTAACNDEKCSL